MNLLSLSPVRLCALLCRPLVVGAVLTAALAGCASLTGEQSAHRRESPEEKALREGGQQDRLDEQRERASELLRQDPGISLSDLPPARLAVQTNATCLAAIETVAERFSGRRVMLGDAAFVDSSDLVLDQVFQRDDKGQLLDGKRGQPRPFVLQLRFGPRGCMAVVPAQSSAVLPVPGSQLLRECRCLTPPAH